MMAMIARRLTCRMKLPKSRWPPRASGLRASTSGTTRSFDTIMASATHSTITIAVAADSPPINTIMLMMVVPDEIGSASTNMSLSTAPNGNVTSPASAIGITNRLMATR